MPEFQNLKYNKPKMQPPVVSAHDCSLFLCSFKQSKAVLRLKEDMKKVVARPGRGQPAVPGRRLLGVHLEELHREGLVVNGVPCLVWNIVEYLRTEGLTQEGLFRVNGNVKVVEQLRNKYENGEQVILADYRDVHSAASLLKMFLREMPDGIISMKVIPRFIQVYHDCGSDRHWENSLKGLIKDLPDTHYSLLKYLCHFLMQVVEHHAQNRMNVYNLATVFGPSCFHVSPGPDCMKQQETCNKILESMLEDYEKIFHCEPTERDGPSEDMAGIITVREYSPEQPYCPERCVDVEESKHSPLEKEAVQDSASQQLNNSEIDCLKSSESQRGKKEIVQGTLKRQLSNTESDFAKLSSPRIKEAALDHSPRQLHSVEHEVLKVSSPRIKASVWESPLRELNNTEFRGVKSSSPRTKEVSQEFSARHINNTEHDLFKSLIREETERDSSTGQLDNTEYYKSPGRKDAVQRSSARKVNIDELDCKSSPQKTEGIVQNNPVKKLEDAECHFLKSSSPRRKEAVLETSTLINAEIDCLTSSIPRVNISKPKAETRLKEFQVPQPKTSDGVPQARPLGKERKTSLEELDLLDHTYSFSSSKDSQHSSQEDERPMSPFYMSSHVAQVNAVPAGSRDLLEKTIRTAVEQHLFDVLGPGSQSSDSESGTSSPSTSLSARQRRRHLKEHDETRKKPRDMEVIDKENIPSGCGSLEDGILAQDVEKLQENCSSYIEERSKPKRQKSSSKLSELNDNQESALSTENFVTSWNIDRQEYSGMEVLSETSKDGDNDNGCLRLPPTVKMKIQEHQSNSESKQQRSLEVAVGEGFVPEVPRLDLTSLCNDSNWEEPVPAVSSCERDGTESDEARLSPQAGRLIRQLLEADSDPMLSPRFYAYGHSQQYLDDPEVPPSPPNSHAFISRRRSSSLGSHEEDADEDLTPAQLTRKIQSLKKKIRKFEERFEDDRKYRPSHRDKAGNPEVLKWMNELAKFRKQLKDSKIKISEEDLVPQVRQRSNTLPKSFGSQLEREEERKPEVAEKVPKPSIEMTMESIQKKLKEKRLEVDRPEDIKDMTRDQIAAEKVSLQKALLFYESVHGRPGTKNERQVMKPLYDRYRLFKQILYRANTIPVIGSPTSKRRSPLLQPIIEGETASFFKEEEEEGSEDDTNTNTDFVVPMKQDFTVRSFLDQLDEDADGFVSPVDDKAPSKTSQDPGLANLHSASIPELLQQLQEAKEEKKNIRKKLRDFEDNFFRQNGRNVQKEDRTPMVEEYGEYKHVKAKLRLLEVLISKRGTSQTV
uniref:Family with sequence similarity 13 member A n=1 Tax=Leptobrachium leishanense TaxID=445787 RepID=A0A8C5PBM2_9ANUR